MKMAQAAVMPSWWAIVRQLLAIAEPHSRALAWSLWGLVAAAALQGVALASLVPILHIVLAPHGVDWLVLRPYLWGVTGITLVILALRWWSQGFDYHGKMGEVTDYLRRRLGEQLRQMPLLKLQNQRSGEVNTVVLSNVDEHLNYTLTVANILTQAMVTPVVTGILVCFWEWRLGLALLLVFPLIVPFYRWRRPAFRRFFVEVNAANARCHADILEYMQGLPIVLAANREGVRSQRLQASFLELERLQVDTQKRAARANVWIASVVELSMLAVMALGVTWVTRSSLEVATLAAVMLILVRFAEPLSIFVNVASVIFGLTETALQQIEKLLSVPPLPQQLPVQRPERFDVCFDAVDFRYDENDSSVPLVLQGCSFTVPMCSMTALVGASGCGKTTVTRLLMRHADPLAGVVRVGGVDVRAIEPDALHSLISVVFQDVYLFDDTVLANIRMARPDASDREVIAAAEAAHCLEFIQRLPEKWHTRLGEQGGRLSGGERQRLSIARALLKNAPIVILDEPTAALDTESECAVQAAIEALVRNRTVIVIAHRLSTIVAADQIVVLDSGRVMECGTHAELLAQSGRYSALWRAQQSVKTWRVK